MISLQNSVFDQCRQQRGRLTSFGEQWKPAQQTKAVDDQETEDEHQDIKKNINNKSNRNFQFFVGLWYFQNKLPYSDLKKEKKRVLA